MGGVEKIGDFIKQVKDKNSQVRLMGFGHRVYKNYDPRAKLMRETCHEVLGRSSTPASFERAIGIPGQPVHRCLRSSRSLGRLDRPAQRDDR